MTVDEYVNDLPEDRRAAIRKLRALVKKNLPKGYKEGVGYNMITWTVPLSTFPDTYNGQPLCYIALASQKNHMALYLLGPYGDTWQRRFLADEFRKAGKKLDMGKSCLRFKKLEDLPLDAIASVVARTSPDELIAIHESAHAAKRKSRAKKK